MENEVLVILSSFIVKHIFLDSNIVIFVYCCKTKFGSISFTHILA